MSVCICGATVTWATSPDGRRVPLEAFTSPTGDGRYRVVSYGDPWLVEPVNAAAQLAAYPDHSKNCPRRA